VEVAAARAQNESLRQQAQLSLATIDARRGGRWAADAQRTAERIAQHGVTPEISASAWLVLGHMRRNKRSANTVQAYQRAYELAPKPSPLADAARHLLEGLGSAPEGELRESTAKGAVHLLYPHRDVLVGNVDFVAAVPAHTRRVELFLDDARVDELTSAPFRSRIALGNSPRVHVIRAVAYDQQDARVGEESVTINTVAQSLGITIVSPREGSVESEATIEVMPRLPANKQLAGVDLYWNEQKLTTLTAPPFRYQLTLPSQSAPGYVRAVVRDTDGATAEDVQMLNSGTTAAEMRVDAVQVYALVQDRKGLYVEGLTARDFVVQEDGRTVEPELQSAPTDSIAVGLALDTSSSMQLAMIEVIEAANLFVKQSLSDGDQTFVVAFNQMPRLLQPLTADRQQVSAAIYDMRSQGGTALWDAMLFSLQQFHDVRGKRALVVFSDGDNTGGNASPAATLQYAREIGVPVYVVQIVSDPKMRVLVGAGGRQTLARAAEPNGTDALRKLAEATGGAMFRLTREEDLSRIFAQIRDDTRGEYLLSYVSPSTKPPGQMRKISVTVPNRDVTVRAMSGYYPR
jgi:Ca-activated chloride channel family protein